MGIQGTIRGKPRRTRVPDRSAPCPSDKVNRQFRVPAPDMLRGRPLWRHWSEPNGRRFHSCRHLGALPPWLSSSTPMPGGSSAGGSVPRPRQVLCSMPSDRLSMIATRSRARGSSTIPTAGHNTCRSNIRRDRARQASNLPAAASVTAMTMRWRDDHRLVQGRGSSIGAARGAASRWWNTPRMDRLVQQPPFA